MPDSTNRDAPTPAAGPDAKPAEGGGESPQPTTDAGTIASQVPEVGQATFAALVSEPATGVGLISIDGQLVYLNQQAASIFHGEHAKPSEYVGRFWRDHMPEEWVSERLKVLRAMLVHDKPVLMRTIWRGFQQFTWITRIEREVDAEAAEPELFLTITRRAASDEEAERLRPKSDYEEVESGVMRLGRLDTLSARELEVIALLGQGLSVKEVAGILHRSEKTIDNHRSHIHEKLRVGDRVALAEIARRAGLTLADSDRTRV
jgi:DNA-binding CsgD family transcriptional regulator